MMAAQGSRANGYGDRVLYICQSFLTLLKSYGIGTTCFHNLPGAVDMVSYLYSTQYM